MVKKKKKVKHVKVFCLVLARKKVVSDFANSVNNDRRGMGIGAKDEPSNSE